MWFQNLLFMVIISAASCNNSRPVMNRTGMRRLGDSFEWQPAIGLEDLLERDGAH